MLVKNVLLKKCSYYYEFEKLLRDSSIITSSFVLKSTRYDSEDSKISREEEKDKEERERETKTKKMQDVNINENEYEN